MSGAVLFDLDDTLLIDEPDVDACFRRVTHDLEVAANVPAGTIAISVRAAARERWHSSPHHHLAMQLGFSSWEGLAADFVGGHDSVTVFREWAPGYRVDAWASGLADFASPSDAVRCSERYRRDRRARYRLFPDAIDVLTEVRNMGWRIGIVTNGPPDLQREKLVATGLVTLVDSTTISGEVGEGKPGAAIFEHALARLGVTPADAVMVGDSLKRDMAGAAALGIRSVWRRNFSAEEKEWETAIDSLSELTPLLR